MCDTAVQAGLGVVWQQRASHLLPVLCVFLSMEASGAQLPNSLAGQ